jgi:hypothetical protein
VFCGVSDLVGGMSDTCGDNGVTLSAGGWDSVRRGCEAAALLASGSLVGPVAIGGAGIGPVCGLEVASAEKWPQKLPQVREGGILPQWDRWKIRSLRWMGWG